MKKDKKTTYRLDILRQESPDAEPYLQSFLYETEDESATVATALTAICDDPDFRDVEGKPAGTIGWECSCLQKRCGACAMVINGYPRLACDSVLSRVQRRGAVRVEPLKKFPVVRDLIVDRQPMMENLKRLRIWPDESTAVDGDNEHWAYEASRCLQCGLCLEICPNFYAAGPFAGTAALSAASRLLAENEKAGKSELARDYGKYVYEGCGRSLACHDVCPAHVPVDDLLIHSNALAVWKRRGK